MTAATMTEIAELCGLSRATVSAVLNGKSGVSEKTRNKVLRVIRDHQLQHRLIARSLMGHFSQMFAVVVPDITNPFYHELFEGFLGEMKLQGNHMLCHPTDGSHADEVRTLETLAGYDLGGCVLVPLEMSASRDHLRKYMETGKPLVTLGSLPDLATHTVNMENRRGSKLATDYLLKQGHRNILCLAGLPTSTPSKERVLGFVESLLEHDVAFNDSMISWTDAHSNTGYTKALEVLTSAQPRPTAVLCFNDVVAIGVYRAAYELGLHIPRDISVVGFDDIAIASVLGPPLTTISVAGSEVGRAAARILLSVTQGQHKGRTLHETIRASLVERGSVRPV